MLRVFALSHVQERLDRLPAFPWLTPVRLDSLEASVRDNRLGEHRFFLSEPEAWDVEWVGVLNARAVEKYHLGRFGWGSIPGAVAAATPNQVLAPWPTNAPWMNVGPWHPFSLKMHPSMGSLLDELASVSGKPAADRVSLWANDFICHRSVWDDFLPTWRRWFFYFHRKYGFTLPFETFNTDSARHPAYFYERLACHYFASRDDLDVRLLSAPPS